MVVPGGIFPLQRQDELSNISKLTRTRSHRITSDHIRPTQKEVHGMTRHGIAWHDTTQHQINQIKIKHKLRSITPQLTRNITSDQTQLFVHHITSPQITPDQHQFKYIASHPATSHNIATHHITSHLITSRQITPDHITPDHIRSRHITSHQITPDHLTSYHVTPDHNSSPDTISHQIR